LTIYGCSCDLVRSHRRDQLLATGFPTSAEIDQHPADIANGNLDPAAFPVVSAWCRKAS